MNKRSSLSARLDQIDSVDPHQRNPALQSERQLIIMELMGVNELNTTKLPPGPSMSDNGPLIHLPLESQK
jgi:hypothetical protein